MVHLIEENLQGIVRLCREYGVARLEVFGSAATEGFDPRKSDLDFLVTFPSTADLGPWLSRYFALKRDLEDLLRRPVDLVLAEAPSQAFLDDIRDTRTLLYAA